MNYVNASFSITTTDADRIQHAIDNGTVSSRSEYIRIAIQSYEDQRVDRAIAESHADHRAGRSYTMGRNETLRDVLSKVG
jgi:Arc/MetJ-type ribon-helix-helix transcriptional regulator